MMLGGPALTHGDTNMEPWATPIELVAATLKAAGDHLSDVAKRGDMDFMELSRINHVLVSAQQVLRCVPDSMSDIRTYLSERKINENPD